ncbi:MAG: TrkH family potassium uptake protein, partial [Gaiellales bacterium]
MDLASRIEARVPRGGLAVDIPSTLNLVGGLVKYVSLAFVFPTILAVGFDEPFWPVLAAGAITFATGFVVELVTTGKERVGVREGFLVVALIWLFLPAFGAIPYFLAGEGLLGQPLNAYFESVSGFTATG